MKKSLILIAVLTALPFISRADQVVKVEITPRGLFAKTQTFLVPLPADGSPGIARCGTECKFFRCTGTKSQGGTVENQFVADTQFFGYVLTVTRANGRMVISFLDRQLASTLTTEDGLSTAPVTITHEFAASFAGNHETLRGGLSGTAFKRVSCTVL